MRYTRLDPKKASALLLLVFQCLLGIILLGHRGCEPRMIDKPNNQSSIINNQFLFVHVVGNVKSPGVYNFPASSSPTRKDAVAAAGGLVNPSSPTDLSTPVKDEEQVLIE